MEKRKPIVFFDDQIFRLQRFGGISRYFGKLINILKKQQQVEIFANKYFSLNEHLYNEQLSKFNFIHFIKKFKGKGKLIQFIFKKKTASIQKKIRKGNYDIFHPTYYETNFIDLMPVEKHIVLTVHDMIHELYFDNLFNTIHNETKQKQQLIPKASHIIAISEYTKNDILRLYPTINPEKISVIYHGYSPTVFNRKKNISTKYLLFVGTRGYYKNFNWLINALQNFLKDNNFFLYCAGGGRFNENEINLIAQLGLVESIKYFDIEDDDYLNNLYSNATCFIFPSIYEGFGLPILEAFANKCPVILANATCFPEIAKDAALYFEVDNANSLLEQINTVLLDKDKVDFILQKADERLKFFSWDKMVEEHTKVYNLVTNFKTF